VSVCVCVPVQSRQAKNAAWGHVTRSLGCHRRPASLSPSLPPSPTHHPHTPHTTTGAGVLFGNTGGVMEAAVRTVYEVVTGKVSCLCFEFQTNKIRGRVCLHVKRRRLCHGVLRW
jgi:hypothetical protein